jgi:hypothetical protein
MQRVIGACLLGLLGCSGAAETDLEGPLRTPTESELGTAPAPAKDGTTASGAQQTETPPSKVAPKTDPSKCVAEVEDNDDSDNATSFTDCVAGSILGHDRDHLAVVAPPNAKRMLVSHTESGRLLFQLENDPTGYALNAAETVKIPVEAGETYHFEVSSFRSLDEARTYELRVRFE